MCNILSLLMKFLKNIQDTMTSYHEIEIIDCTYSDNVIPKIFTTITKLGFNYIFIFNVSVLNTKNKYMSILTNVDHP